ncbi:DUF3566 domain-containing protein [Catenuloplanes atrovinosus]|uniref:DUF3566 domain-containing protein n=1 Tax=Catenuloplanes atrovinosus TaxID=137266 RepID=A0AAE4CFV9_9ACTN|nr:DUF3566 domain-containing protein [Catenuloplanes atrovinosus]MDR7280065.1 hypothetical protein [Catenuloplanes atrovinosus]
MTETQATSGAGTSATPAGKDSADGDAKAKGRAVVGRAVVGPSTDAPSPKFTRPPGMKPPPDEAPAGSSSATAAKPATTGAGADKDTTKPVIVPAGKPATASSAASASKSATAAPAKPGAQPKASPAGGSPSGPPGERTERIPSGAGATGTSTSTSGLSGLGNKVSGAVRSVGAAKVTDTIRAARNAVGSAGARGPRRARLNVKRIDPWSVMKFSFAVSLVLFIVLIVATSVLYLALDAMGVFQSVNETLQELVSASGGDSGGAGFKITARGVIGTSALLGLVNVVLLTALATLGAFIYNVCADLVGGIELTLAERD